MPLQSHSRNFCKAIKGSSLLPNSDILILRAPAQRRDADSQRLCITASVKVNTAQYIDISHLCTNIPPDKAYFSKFSLASLPSVHSLYVRVIQADVSHTFLKVIWCCTKAARCSSSGRCLGGIPKLLPRYPRPAGLLFTVFKGWSTCGTLESTFL